MTRIRSSSRTERPKPEPPPPPKEKTEKKERSEPSGLARAIPEVARSVRDQFVRAAEEVREGVDAVRSRGVRPTAQDAASLAVGAAGAAVDVVYNSASHGVLSPTPALRRAAERGPAAGDRTHAEVDGSAKLLAGLDVRAASGGVGGKIKPFFSEGTENLGDGRFRTTVAENIEILGAAELGVSGKFGGLGGKYEGGLVIRASRSYETNEADANRVLDATRVERLSQAVGLAAQRPTFLESLIQPTRDQRELLRDAHVATEVEIRGRDRGILEPKLSAIAGTNLAGLAPELENRLDVNRGVRVTHLPQEDAVEVSFFVGGDFTTKQDLKLRSPIAEIEGSSLSDHYNDELEVTLRFDATDRQGLDRPEGLLEFVDQLQGEVMPEEVRIQRTTRAFDPLGQDDGLSVFGDGTHSPSTTKQTTLTIDTRGAETKHLAGLLQRDPATLQALVGRTTVTQTLERAEPERLGPADLDIGGEVKAQIGKKASLAVGFEAEMVTWDVVAAESRDISRREAVDEILRPFPLRGEATPSGPLESPPSSEATYTVRCGDTLSGIAHAHDVELPNLIDVNPQIENPDLIFPGQTIHLPGPPEPPAPSPPPPGLESPPGAPSSSPPAPLEGSETGPTSDGPAAAQPEPTEVSGPGRTIANDGWPESIAPELHVRANELGQQETPGVELMTRVMDEAFTHYSETAGYRPRDAMDAAMRDMAAVFLDEGGVEAVLGPTSVLPGFARDFAEQVRSLDPGSMPPVPDPTPAADFRPRFRDVSEEHGALGHNQIYHTMAYIVGGYATNNSALVGAGAVLHEAEANSGVPELNEADARVGSVGGDLGVLLRNLRDSDPDLEEARAMMTLTGAHLAEDGVSWGDPSRSWNRGVDRSELAARVDERYQDPNLGEDVVGGLGWLSAYLPGIQEAIRRPFGG